MFLSSEIKEAYSQQYSNIFTDDALGFENNKGEIKPLLEMKKKS